MFAPGVVREKQGATIETRTVFNELGLPVDVYDPRGTQTRTVYDSLMRPTHVTAAFGTDEAVTTQMIYESAQNPNAGGSAFNTSGFKPTKLITPRKTVATVNDSLYRPTTVTVSYVGSTTGDAVTSTTYDKNGNVLTVTDPLNKVTSTDYDGLNRPTKVTHPDNTFVTTDYTSTGLKWRVTNERGHYADTVYDGMGRPIEIIGALVAAPNAPPQPGEVVAPTVRPRTKTVYDDGGLVKTTIDPLGRRTDIEYDNRNRKWKVYLPECDVMMEDGAQARVRPMTEIKYDVLGNVRDC